jgi:hypothetical protein
MKPYYAWVTVRTRVLEDIIFHENSKRFAARRSCANGSPTPSNADATAYKSKSKPLLLARRLA